MHKEIHRHHSRMQEHGWTGVLGAGKHLGRGIGHGGYTGIGSGGILGKYGGMSGNKKKSSFW